MKTLIPKPISTNSAATKRCSHNIAESVTVIKIKSVSHDDRERLRIPTYQYLLP